MISVGRIKLGKILPISDTAIYEIQTRGRNHNILCSSQLSCRIALFYLFSSSIACFIIHPSLGNDCICNQAIRLSPVSGFVYSKNF